MPSPQYAREISTRYRLEGSVCSACGKRSHPPRRVCPVCRGTEFTVVQLAREGAIVSYTIIHTGPQDLAMQTPYAVAIIELDDGARLTAQVVDCSSEELRIGARVRAVFRRFGAEGHDGIIHYGHKFVLK